MKVTKLDLGNKLEHDSYSHKFGQKNDVTNFKYINEMEKCLRDKIIININGTNNDEQYTSYYRNIFDKKYRFGYDKIDENSGICKQNIWKLEENDEIKFGLRFSTSNIQKYDVTMTLDVL